MWLLVALKIYIVLLKWLWSVRVNSFTLLGTAAFGLVGLRWKARSTENIFHGIDYVFKYHSLYWPPLCWNHTSRFLFVQPYGLSDCDLFFTWARFHNLLRLHIGADHPSTWVQLHKYLCLLHFVRYYSSPFTKFAINLASKKWSFSETKLGDFFRRQAYIWQCHNGPFAQESGMGKHT